MQLNQPIQHFERSTESGVIFRSQSLVGHKHMVLFFYPKDSTPV
jgi:peroxiredoxin